MKRTAGIAYKQNKCIEMRSTRQRWRVLFMSGLCQNAVSSDIKAEGPLQIPKNVLEKQHKKSALAAYTVRGKI